MMLGDPGIVEAELIGAQDLLRDPPVNASKNGYTLERQIGWDALGMRGTASSGYQAHRRRCERADPAGKLR